MEARILGEIRPLTSAATWNRRFFKMLLGGDMVGFIPAHSGTVNTHLRFGISIGVDEWLLQ
jgi:hypothetical protein